MVNFCPASSRRRSRDCNRRATAETSGCGRSSRRPGSADDGAGGVDAANPAPRATLAHVADHIDHIVKVAGIDHVGLGSDFDGITSVVQGLEDVSTYPDLIAELLRRGYSDEDIAKITRRNILRVMRGAEAVAASLQRTARPSIRTIEDLDHVTRTGLPVPANR